MKIGILTYHSTRNCGAVLQAYALTKFLDKIGIDSEIIDYKCKKIEEAYKIKKLWELRNVKELVKWLLSVKTQKQATERFFDFSKQYLKLSNIVYNNDNILKSNDVYDAFITGSDQVWNFNLNGIDENYILKFADKDKKKISYAASMGYKNIPEEFRNIYFENLKDFDGISLREIEALKNITDMGYKADLVLDPTLLLSKEEYCFAKTNNKDKYIFVYTVAATPNIYLKAKELSKKTGLKIKWAHMSYKTFKGVKNYKNPSPEQFLELIENAEYVLTSSFHGMALSIVLNKQFFYDLDIKKENNNSRLTTLSSLLELEDREITKDKDLLLSEDIDYNKVNIALDKKRAESLEFLKESLGIK